MSWVEQTAEDGKGSADVDVAAEPEVAETLLEETIEEEVEVACDTVDVVELDEV